MEPVQGVAKSEGDLWEVQGVWRKVVLPYGAGAGWFIGLPTIDGTQERCMSQGVLDDNIRRPCGAPSGVARARFPPPRQGPTKTWRDETCRSPSRVRRAMLVLTKKKKPPAPGLYFFYSSVFL